MSPASTHAMPATMRASAPLRVPNSTTTASAASGGRRSRKGQSGSSTGAEFGAVRIASSASPTSAAASGQTMRSPGQSPTARTRSRPPSTTAPNAAVESASPRGGVGTRCADGRARDERPPRGVEDHAESARDRQHHEAAPDDVRVESEGVGQPGGDTRDHAPFDGTRRGRDHGADSMRARADDRAEPRRAHPGRDSASGSGSGGFPIPEP